MCILWRLISGYEHGTNKNNTEYPEIVLKNKMIHMYSSTKNYSISRVFKRNAYEHTDFTN